MNKVSFISLILGFASLATACKSGINSQKITVSPATEKLLETRYKMLLEYPVDSMSMPRSMTIKTNEVRKVPSRDWTSGFFAGNLWQLYRLTNDSKFKEQAGKWTPFSKKESLNRNSHDVGFKVYCSIGEALKVEHNKEYEAAIVKGAETLCTRFDPKVGAIRSWDFNKEIWDYPVIIDNMMNLELLFEASKISGNSKYSEVAIQHANTTLKNQFRENNSCYHVIDYDPKTGAVRKKTTLQGYSDDSVWARGQGWAVYGFTMSYRYTKDPAYLKQAEATANFFMTNKNLPEDGIPYWDFNDPSIPNVARDVSAAMVMASGLYELYSYTKNEKYLAFADKIMTSVQTEKYILNANIKAPFILDHSTGNWPKHDEIDEPIIYADYYFLEALLRRK
ncbi:glycoside hydrolase family 88 protein [Flavobacterium sp. KACC 22761]|uniref:glycoside hydrolase family 88 protein n=1 Tax=Flavobacterium sp. KACC 22761 TaxID=3092665 RepID=UPI002A75E79B|nr:glycoside hydrolase family 88 protein [Flavobacterium sp. KACC 22761]WPO78412.1 glycoside hydrolase family 88 protein [Flavobacterium sp. KACC 22761]